MFEHLKKIETRYHHLRDLLAEPKTLEDKNLYTKYAKEFADLNEIVRRYKDYQALLEEMSKVEAMAQGRQHHHEPDFLQLVEDELAKLKQKKVNLERELEEMLLAEADPAACKDIIVEIRAGTGGEEAGLFVADIYRMYSRYAVKEGWTQEILSSRPTELGGFKEIVFSLQGEDVFKKLRYESGVHRVQRIPATEASGRIHTSAVSVAILPEPEEVEVKIDPKELRIDVFRSAGHGGQSVNTTDSAVRITHLPSGIVVSCQDERSQLKNKVKAMRVLRARLLDKTKQEQEQKISQQRRTQVGSGDRSEKIRTYNFPGQRVTDHRIGLTIHRLEAVLDGELDELVKALMQEDKSQRLKQWKSASN